MQEQQQDSISIPEINSSSINTFLNSYQKLKKLEPNELDYTNPFKLPSENDFYLLNAKIKCTNFLIRLKNIDDANNSIPMFAYQEWNQLSSEIKKVFQKKFQTHVKQLNAGNLLKVKPQQSLNIRTDYYCFHPHQVYTTLLSLDKNDMNTGTIGICKNSLNLENFNNQNEAFDSIIKQKLQIQWQYGDLRQGYLIILGKDVLYGSFRNDSPITKFYAEMRWVRHDSASSSSTSS